MAVAVAPSKNVVRAVSMGRSRVPGVGRMPAQSLTCASGSPSGLCGRSIRARVSATAWLVREIPPSSARSSGGRSWPGEESERMSVSSRRLRRNLNAITRSVLSLVACGVIR
jgi:hypothetical protein